MLVIRILALGRRSRITLNAATNDSRMSFADVIRSGRVAPQMSFPPDWIVSSSSPASAASATWRGRSAIFDPSLAINVALSADLGWRTRSLR